MKTKKKEQKSCSLAEAREARLAVLKRIDKYEAEGGEKFFCDVENDPPVQVILPDEVDYLHEKAATKINVFFARIMEAVAALFIKKKYRIRIEGEENLGDIPGGAIFTSNHFAQTENIAVRAAAKKVHGKHRFYKLIREGNFRMKGIIGYLLKYADTLPVSSNMHTMNKLASAIEPLLKKNAFILIYPELAMWWNYKKPRPYRIGAYHYAAKNGVPVVPCFVSLEASGKKSKLGFAEYFYTVHIMPPLYPDPALTVRANAESMRKKNFELCRGMYEKVYGIPLSNTEN